MDTRAPAVPLWAVPDPQQVRDLLTVSAHHARAGDVYAQGVHDGADWATAWRVTWDQAGQEMTVALAERSHSRHRGAVADTLAWLMGFAAAPIELPRRRADGATPTADQLYVEATEGRRLSPEDRQTARSTAERNAHRWAELARIADHG